jgi:hypothetical protein
MKLFFKQLLNKFASGAANSSAHSLNNLVSIPTAHLDESEARAFSSNSTSPEVISVKSKDLLKFANIFMLAEK